ALGPAGYSRRVTYDGAGRLLNSTDAAGLSTAQTWAATGDLLQTTTDPNNLETSTVYNAEHRPTDTYGPAPAGQFNGGLIPSGTAPHSTTSYDDNISGLAAQYWFTQSSGGIAPGSSIAHGTGLDQVTNLAQVWTQPGGHSNLLGNIDPRYPENNNNWQLS